MDIFTSLKVSSSALTVQRYRMNIISSNLANIETIKTKEGGPYKRKEIVVSSEDVSGNFQQILDSKLAGAIKEVKIQGYIDDNRPPVAKYDPSNPEADPDGYVRYPNINIIEEITNLTMASRNYESNVTVISTTKRLALQTLEIGK
jgi:flagellar basal-body rod protein FlgC